MLKESNLLSEIDKIHPDVEFITFRGYDCGVYDTYKISIEKGKVTSEEPTAEDLEIINPMLENLTDYLGTAKPGEK